MSLAEYPSELLEVPTPLIAFMGNVHHHPTLIACLDALNREFSSVSTLRFHSFPLDHTFPLKKSATRRYEGYIPDGILKASWLHKHHMVLPSVVLALFDFDPKISAQDWMSQETVICDEVEKLRNSLGARECRIMVLLQEDDSADPLQDASLVDERLSSLRRRCELDSKFVVLRRLSEIGPRTNPMRKLENLLRALSLEYYHLQAKRVKKHKKHINKTTQLALHVRHSFKVGHFYEFRRQTDKMLKHFTVAYKFCTELLHSQHNLMVEEIKGVADVINYKLCSHRMAALQGREAVLQFQSHVHTFRDCVGAKGTEYRHWHWLSRQYMIFAQLLEQLHQRSRSGGSATATNFHALGGLLHPGYYYHLAAKYAKLRREAAQAAGLFMTASSPDLPEEEAVMVRPPTFIGAMPVVMELEGLTSAAAIAEQKALLEKHLKTTEKQAEHSSKVKSLLKKTADQYSGEPPLESIVSSSSSKRRERLLLYLKLEVVDECIAAEEWNHAQRSLESVREYYLKESWFEIMTSVISKLRDCAGKLGDAEGYIDYSMQLLSPLCSTTEENRVLLQKHILSMLAALDVADLRRLMTASHRFFNTKELPPVIEVMCTKQRLALVSCSVTFSEVSAVVTDKVEVTLSMAHFLPMAVRFAMVDVVFNDERHNKTLVSKSTPQKLLENSVHGEILEVDLLTQPGLASAKEITFKIVVQDKGPEHLHCKRVRLHLSPAISTVPDASVISNSSEISPSTLIFVIDANRCGSVCHNDPMQGPGGHTPAPSRRWGEAAAVGARRSKDQLSGAAADDAEDVNLPSPRTSLQISQPVAQTSFSLAPIAPALTGEWRRVELKIKSNADTVRSARLCLACEPPPASSQPEEAFFWVGNDMSKPEPLCDLQPLPLGSDLQPSWELAPRRLTLADLSPESSSTSIFYVRAFSPGTKLVKASINYTTTQGVLVTAEASSEICTSDALRADYQFLPLYPPKPAAKGRERPHHVLAVGEPVLMQAEIKLDSEQPIQLLNVQVETAQAVACGSSSSFKTYGEILLQNSQSEGPTILRRKGDCYSMCAQFVPRTCGTHCFGKINVTWARVSDQGEEEIDIGEVSTQLQLPTVEVEAAVFTVSLAAPAEGVIGVPMDMSWSIANNSDSLQTVELTLATSQEFLFCGLMQSTVEIQPFTSYTATFPLLPVAAGHLPLPSVTITSMPDKVQLLSEEDNYEIFVRT